MTVALLTLTLSLPAAPAPAPKMERPEGPAPRVVMIAPAAEGKLTLVETQTRLVQQQRTVQVTTADGKVVPVTQTFMVQEPVPVMRIVDLDKVRVFGVDGKKIETKDVPKSLTQPMPALLSADGKPVDRFYLRLARKGTLVLVVPPTEGKFVGKVMPAPAAKLVPPQKLPPPPREK